MLNMRRLMILGLTVAVMAPATALAGDFEDAMKIVDDPKLMATQYDTAVSKFKAASSGPQAAHALYNLGLLAMYKGNLSGAEGYWKDALSKDGKYLAAKARLAEAEIAKGQVASGKAKLEAIVADKANRFQPEARNALAALAIAKKDWKAAKKHARNVLLGDPGNVSAYLNLAVSFYQQGLTDQAGLIASNALKKNAKAAALHNIMGLVYLSRDDSRRASESFHKATLVDPNQIDANLNMATMELAYGDFPGAIKRLERVRKLRKDRNMKDDAMLELTIAVANRGLRKYTAALEGYNKALSIQPNMIEAQYNLCILHHQYLDKTKDDQGNLDKGKWQKALQACETYFKRIDRKHSKYKEIKKRIKAIAETIKLIE